MTATTHAPETNQIKINEYFSLTGTNQLCMMKEWRDREIKHFYRQKKMVRQTVDISVVAKEVGLSKTTVSYILSGKYQQVKIAPDTAKRVLQVADKLGYRSNFWAKSLVNKRSRLIGVLYPDITGSAAHQITEGIQEALGEKDYETVLAVSFWNRRQEMREIELMLEKRVEGIIALPQAGSEQTFQVALNANCPVVHICDWLPGVQASSVTLDVEDAVFKVLYHLHQLGKKKIHLLAVDYPSKTLEEREDAFKNGLSKLGLPVSPDSVTYTELAKEMSVYEKTRAIVERADRPDALVCISDAIAMYALSELARLGVRIPEDLAVAGIGNLQFTDHPFFALTTVDECRKEIGRQAVNLMLRQINEEYREIEHIRIKGPLITRQSTVGGSRLPIF
jgi:LacI family transcriptional regulator